MQIPKRVHSIRPTKHKQIVTNISAAMAIPWSRWHAFYRGLAPCLLHCKSEKTKLSIEKKEIMTYRDKKWQITN